MMGDPRKKHCLLKAGIEGASKVIVMSMGKDLEESREYADSSTLMVSHLIYSLFDAGDKKYCINDLHDKENIKFLRPTAFKVRKRVTNQGKDDIDISKRSITEDTYTYTPIYASGRVLASSMLGSILYQAHYNPFIVQVFRFFCGVRTEEELDLEHYLETDSKTLSYVAIPSSFIGSCFSDLFCYFLQHEIIAIGLLRNDISPELGNRLPFVYTNPMPSLILKESDLVYILASDLQLH